MRTSIVLASALALAACNSAPEEVAAPVEDTRTPEERVQTILDSSIYRGMCGGQKNQAERNTEDDRGEYSPRAGMSERDAYFARRAFNEETENLVTAAGETAYNSCMADKVADAGLTETYEAMKAAETAPEAPAAN